MADLIAGRLDVIFAPLVEVLPFVRTGQVRPMGVTRTERMSSVPDLQTIAETVPGYDFSGWIGIFGPPGLPQPIVQRMSMAIAEAVRRPETKARLEQLGYIPVGGTAEALAERQRLDYAQMEELVRLTGATAD
jgi:tripartite-type tricarboxylate transporter receptor subunit TctC